MGCKIQNNSQIEIEDYIKSLVDFAKDRMGFKQYPDIVLGDDKANASNVLGKTAYYDPNRLIVHIYTNNRHPKDILRSIAHELVHHTQHENGEFDGNHYTGPGYAQKDPKMREMERQAYEQGNLCLRDWEDGIKAQNETIYKERSNNTMSLKEWKNEELNRLLMKKFGLLKESLEEEQAVEEEVVEEETIEEEHVHDSECGCPDQEEGEVAIVQLAEEGKDERTDADWEARGEPTFDKDGLDDFMTRKHGPDKSKWPGRKKEENIQEALKIAMEIIKSKLEK